MIIIHLLAKLDRKFACIFDGNFAPSRERKKGYQGTSVGPSKGNFKNGTVKTGLVDVKAAIDQKNVFNLGNDKAASAADVIWEQLCPIWNKTGSVMKKLLTNLFEVTEWHPLIEQFPDATTPADVLTRFGNSMKETDARFKREGVPVGIVDDEINLRRVDEIEPEDEDVVQRYRDRLTSDVLDALKVRGLEGADDDESDEEDYSDEEDESRDAFETQLMQILMSEWEIECDAASAFAKVITVENWKTIEDNPDILLDAMAMLRMKSREQGTTTGVQGFGSLKERWWKKEVKLDDVEKGANANSLDQEIKRGTIISLEEGSERRFVVMVVSAKLNNKWFSIRLIDKYPKWPFKKGDEKKYRFELREVVMKGKDNEYVLKPYSSITDGVNVRDTYRLIQLGDVKDVFNRIVI